MRLSKTPAAVLLCSPREESMTKSFRWLVAIVPALLLLGPAQAQVKFGYAYEVPVFTNSSNPAPRTADINEDGRADLLVYARPILLSGPGGYTESATLWIGQTVADLTGDGHLDLLAAVGDGTALIYAGHGDGSFESAGIPVGSAGSGDTWYPLEVADATGDGHADIITGTALFTGDGTGAFVRIPRAFNVAMTVSDVIFRDLNGDGHWDAAVLTPTVITTVGPFGFPQTTVTGWRVFVCHGSSAAVDCPQTPRPAVVQVAPRQNWRAGTRTAPFRALRMSRTTRVAAAWRAGCQVRMAGRATAGGNCQVLRLTLLYFGFRHPLTPAHLVRGAGRRICSHADQLLRSPQVEGFQLAIVPHVVTAAGERRIRANDALHEGRSCSKPKRFR